MLVNEFLRLPNNRWATEVLNRASPNMSAHLHPLSGEANSEANSVGWKPLWCCPGLGCDIHRFYNTFFARKQQEETPIRRQGKR